MARKKRIPPSSRGEDRRHGRSLARELLQGKSDFVSEEPEDDDTTLDEWSAEDVAEQERMRQAQKNINLGYPEDYEGERGY